MASFCITHLLVVSSEIYYRLRKYPLLSEFLLSEIRKRIDFNRGHILGIKTIDQVDKCVFHVIFRAMEGHGAFPLRCQFPSDMS